MWTNVLIEKYLGDAKSFERLYCRDNSDEVLGTLQRIEGVDSESLRKVIYKLAKALPYGAHASPGWDYKNLPAVKIGVKFKDRITGNLSCGVLALHGKLFFWIDKSCVVYDSKRCEDELWSEYRYTDRIREDRVVTKFYYNNPLDCKNDFDDRLKHLLSKLSEAQNKEFHAYCDRKPKERRVMFTDMWVPKNAV